MSTVEKQCGIPVDELKPASEFRAELALLRKAQLLVERSLIQKENAKRRYAKADELLDAVLKLGLPVGTKFTLKDGRTATIVDNFDGTNVGWGHGSVRRFDVKVK